MNPTNPSELLRVYLDPADIETWGQYVGYPHAWAKRTTSVPVGVFVPQDELYPRIPDYVRELAGHRCVRCKHPFIVGETPGQWSPCDELCTHGGPIASEPGGRDGTMYTHPRAIAGAIVSEGQGVCFAQWRVLTVHHLNGVKFDCRWWNLVSLCQRCHLTIQAKVWMDRPWNKPHSEWFRPYVAGYYASLEGLELSREETVARMDELLERHNTQGGLFE